MGRYAYVLLKALTKTGLQIGIKANFSFLSRLDKYKKLLLRENFKIISDSVQHSDSIKFSASGKEVRVVSAEPLAPIKFNNTCFPFPYMMHPRIYELGYDLKSVELRNNPRKGKILFAGNAEKKNYSGGNVATFYQKTTRYGILTFLEKHSLLNVKVIKDKSDFTQDVYANQLTIARSQAFKIPFEEWLPTLGLFDFFLACPGSDMPMCHNVIEAMSVGSIPIVEYPEYFHPALEHGKNCIVFNGKEDLVSQLQGVINMDQQAIDTLRRGTITYYDNYLKPEVWVSKMVDPNTEITELVFNAWKVRD
ncbi:hypothetical protein WJR50_16890 [Catalinimonas sp. 4WD22]|uniref:hypothetical protein n=1 Tax=Catalinimonas locisalis TaxID=3133978 RepID=UPI0031010DCB